jgi:hypothetical protein
MVIDARSAVSPAIAGIILVFIKQCAPPRCVNGRVDYRSWVVESDRLFSPKETLILTL